MLMARSTPAQKPRGLASRISMTAILRLPRCSGLKHSVEYQQSRSDRDRRIRQVEGPEMPPQGVEVEKIDDMAEGDPVPEVAERPAQYERETRREQALLRMPREHRHDDRRRDDGDGDEERPLPAPGVGEEAERGAAVVREHQ